MSLTYTDVYMYMYMYVDSSLFLYVVVLKLVGYMLWIQHSQLSCLGSIHTYIHVVSPPD